MESSNITFNFDGINDIDKGDDKKSDIKINERIPRNNNPNTNINSNNNRPSSNGENVVNLNVEPPVEDNIRLEPTNPSYSLSTVDQDVVDSHKIRISIVRYYQTFSKYLDMYGDRLSLVNLEPLTKQELEILLQEVKITVGCRSSSSLISNLYFGSLAMAEALAPKVNMKLDGLANAIASNQNIVETIKEISLEYESMSYIPPIYRLALFTSQSILYVNNHNKAEEKKKDFLNEKVNNEIVNEFDDI